jgi:hypothetical protein
MILGKSALREVSRLHAIPRKLSFVRTRARARQQERHAGQPALSRAAPPRQTSFEQQQPKERTEAAAVGTAPVRSA